MTVLNLIFVSSAVSSTEHALAAIFEDQPGNLSYLTGNVAEQQLLACSRLAHDFSVLRTL